MEDKLYKTPNGKTFEETYLRERYGDKFGLFVATGQLVEIEGGTIEDEVQLEEEIWIAPNGKEFMTSELVERYGPDGFEKYKDQFKKKNPTETPIPTPPQEVGGENVESDYSIALKENLSGSDTDTSDQFTDEVNQIKLKKKAFDEETQKLLDELYTLNLPDNEEADRMNEIFQRPGGLTDEEYRIAELDKYDFSENLTQGDKDTRVQNILQNKPNNINYRDNSDDPSPVIREVDSIYKQNVKNQQKEIQQTVDSIKQANQDAQKAAQVNRANKKREEEAIIKLQQDGIKIDEDFKSSLNLINEDFFDYTSSKKSANALNAAFNKYGISANSGSLPYGQTGRHAVFLTNKDGSSQYAVKFTDVKLDKAASMKELREFIIANAVEPKDNYIPDAEEEDIIRKSFRAKNSRTQALVNPDGTLSTHLFTQYEEDGKFYVVPTLFPKDPNQSSSRREDWFKLDMDDSITLAKRRGEVFEFATEKEAQDFAEGAWKNVSTVDLEGEKFYKERGLDYSGARTMYDEYEAARDERLMIDDILERLENSDKYYEFSEEEIEEIKLKYPDLVVDGRVILDAGSEEETTELRQRRDELLKIEESRFEGVIDNQDMARAREDFDAYLAGQRRKNAQGAAAINRLAKYNYTMLDAEVINTFGVRASDLVNYVPTEEWEAEVKNDYIAKLNTIVQTEDAAALKYDLAKTYFTEKENKNIQAEFTDNWEAIQKSWTDGYARGMAIEQIVMMQLGITDMEDPNDKAEAALKISEALSQQSGTQSRVNARYFGQKTSAEGWNNFKRDPMEWALGLAANSISQMLPYGMWIIPSTTATGVGIGAVSGAPVGGVGAVPGAITGGAWGLRTGFGATSFAMEYGNAFLEAMDSQGYNFLNPADVEMAIMDEKVWEETNDRGVKRGLTIGTVDFISAGLAGRVFKAGTLATRTTALGAFTAERFVFDPFMEATGEYLAQKSVGDEIDWLEVGAEAGGGFGNQSSQAAVNVYIDQRNRSTVDIADKLANNRSFFMNERASNSRISEWANNMFQLGKIDEATNQKIQKNVGTRKTVNELLGVNKASRLNSGKTRRVRTRLSELIEAKNLLTATPSLKEVYAKTIKEINEEIRQTVLDGDVVLEKDIQNNENVGGTGVNLDAVLGKTKEDAAPTYYWRGKLVTKAKFMNNVEKQKEPGALQKLRNKLTGTIGASTKVFGDFEAQVELKKLKDAIQERSTKKVDVQEQTTDGGTVGEGNVQQELTIESVETETTKPEELAVGTNAITFTRDGEIRNATYSEVVEDVSKENDEQTTGVKKVKFIGEVTNKKTGKKRKTKTNVGVPIQETRFKNFDVKEQLIEDGVLEEDFEGDIEVIEVTVVPETTKSKAAGNTIFKVRAREKGGTAFGSVIYEGIIATEKTTEDAVSETTEEAVSETTEEIFSDVELENISEELKDLEAFVKRENPKFSIKPNLTTQEKQKALDDEAYRILTEAENAGLSEDAYTVENPNIQTIPIVVTENSELGKRVKRMGLNELIGKKINLVMADQLVTNSRYMGGPFFPLQDGLYNKVAWASMDTKAANKIIKGAINADYTVVYNMTPNAVNANVAMRTEFLSRLENLDAETQSIIFEQVKDHLANKVYKKDTAKVKELLTNSTTLEEFFDGLDFDVTVKSKVIEDILPFRTKEAQTELGQTLQDLGITLEEVQESITEQFVKDLPAGAMTMVLEVQDKNGNKVTEETKAEALISPKQQTEEGLKQHPNYPVYIRGKAIGLLEETVPFWNVVPTSMETINKKAAGIITDKQGRTRTRKQQERDAMRGAEMNADKARQTSEPTASQYTRFINLLSKAFPGVEVVNDQAMFDELLMQPSVVTLTTKQERTEKQIIYGAVFQGKIYLNPARSNFNTPIHEFGHIWNAMAKEFRPELYNKGIELIQGTEYVTQVLENKQYQKIIKEMREDGATEAEIQEFINEEALATAIGNKGESFVNASIKKGFKNWLNRLFNFVKSVVGLSKYTDEQIQDITLDEFLQGVVVDLLSGQEVFINAEVKNIDNTVKLMAVENDAITTMVSKLRQEGFSDVAIRKYLQSKNFLATEIKEAMAIEADQVLFNDTFVPAEFGNVEGGMLVGKQIFDQVIKKLKAYAKPTRTKPRAETAEEKVIRANKLRAANPKLFALTDNEILAKYPNVGIKGEIKGEPKTKAQIRQKALELLRANEIFQQQPQITQEALIVALDRTIDTRANVQVQQEISAIKRTIKSRREGAKTLQEAKRRLRMYIRGAIPRTDNYTSTQVNKFIKIVAEATDATILRDIDKINAEVEKTREKIKKLVIRDIKKLVKDKSKKRITQSRKGKSKGVSAETQAFMEQADIVLNSVLKNDIDKLESIRQELAENEQEIFQLIIKLNDGQKLTRAEERLVNLAYAYDNFSDLQSLSLEEVQALLKKFKTLRAEGIKTFKSRREARALEQQAINRQAEEQIVEDYSDIVVDDEGNAKNSQQLRRDRENINKLLNEGKYMKWIMTYLNHWRMNSWNSVVTAFTNNMKHLGTLTTQIDNAGRGKFFFENIYKRLNRADEANMQSYFRTQDTIDSIVNTVEGIDNGMKQVRELVYQEGVINIRVREIKSDGTVQENFQTADYNRDQLLRIYALYKDPIQRAKLEKQGFTPKVMEDVEAFLGTQLTGVADKIVEYLSNDYYNGINDVYRQVNDVNLSYIANYFPTQTVSTARFGRMLEDGDFGGLFNAETSPSLKERANVKDGVKTDVTFTQTLQTHVKQMERYKAYAAPTKILAGIMSDPYVVSMLEAMGLTNNVRQAINYAINPDAFAKNSATNFKFINKLQSRYTSFALALKLMQIPKQASSFINALEEYTFRKDKATLGLDVLMFMFDSAVLAANLIAELVDYGLDKGLGVKIGLENKPFQEAMLMSGTFRKRVALGVEGDLMGLESGQPTYGSFETNQKLYAKLGRRGRKLAAMPTIIGDFMGVMGYMVNYRRNIKNGMPKAEALEAFNDYNATQQSRRATEKIPLQMNPTIFTRAFTMFGSTLFLQMNKVMMKADSILMDGYRYATEGQNKQDLPKIKDIRGLYLNLAIANVMFTAMSNIFLLTRGDDEDKQIAYQRMLDAMFGLNLIYALPFIGESAEQAINDLRGTRRKAQGGINPIKSVWNRWMNAVKYDDKNAISEGVKTLIEIYAGVQGDPLYALAEMFGGEFDEDTMYKLLGVSYSYRPKKQKTTRRTTKRPKRESLDDVDVTFEDELTIE